MIKLLNVITSGLGRDGITMTQLEFIKKFDLSDLSITMASVYDDDDPDVVEEFKGVGCNIIKLPNRNKKVKQYFNQLYKHIKQEKYDIIHVHGSSAILATELMTAKLAGVKIRIAHSHNTTCIHDKIDRLLRPFFYRSYTYAFACGKDAGSWLFGNEPFTVIHNGMDFERFGFSSVKRKIIRNKYSIDNKLVLGTVGVMNYAKNHLFLIDVFKKVHDKEPNTVLFIIGDGPNRVKIEEKIKEFSLENSVILTGRISNVQDMLQGMDIMLLPSLHEGLPTVVLEWQTSGLPSFASDKVTDECAVTDLVHFLPIDKGPDIWADAILSTELSGDRAGVSKSACERMKEENFDINEGAVFLKQKYIEFMNKNK